MPESYVYCMWKRFLTLEPFENSLGKQAMVRRILFFGRNFAETNPVYYYGEVVCRAKNEYLIYQNYNEIENTPAIIARLVGKTISLVCNPMERNSNARNELEAF